MSNNTILVAEDEKALLNIIEKKLLSKDFDVVTAKTVEEALDQLESKEVDAVWLDHYLLGQEDGLDFVDSLKNKDSIKKNIPIFVVSNTASSDKVQTYLRLGIDKYYTKSNNKLGEIVEDITQFLKEDEG